MNSEKSEWKSPIVIVSIIGLVISIVANIIQYQQNKIVNNKADVETMRADKEFQRANILQKRKDDWINNLNEQLNNIDQQITVLKENLQLEEVGTTLNNYNDRMAAWDNVQSDSNKLNELEEKRAALENQINDFMSTYR